MSQLEPLLVLKVGDHGQEKAMSEHFRLTTAQIVAGFELLILVAQAEGTRTCVVQAALQMRVELARESRLYVLHV